MTREFKTCPFCGAPPFAELDSMNVLNVVECRNPECMVRPRLRIAHPDHPVLIDAWNHRPRARVVEVTPRKLGWRLIELLEEFEAGSTAPAPGSAAPAADRLK